MKIASTNGQLTFEEMKGSLASMPKNIRERFGSKPERFFGDKIYLNRDNRAALKEMGVEIMGPPL